MVREFKHPPAVRKKMRENARKYRAEHPGYDAAYKEEYRKEHAEEIKKSGARYRKDNASKIKKARKKYYREHTEEIKKRTQEWQKKNPEKVKAMHRDHYLKNRDKYLAKPYDAKKRREAYLGYRDALLARQRAFTALKRGKRLIRPHLENFFFDLDQQLSTEASC